MLTPFCFHAQRHFFGGVTTLGASAVSTTTSTTAAAGPGAGAGADATAVPPMLSLDSRRPRQLVPPAIMPPPTATAAAAAEAGGRTRGRAVPVLNLAGHDRAAAHQRSVRLALLDLDPANAGRVVALAPLVDIGGANVTSVRFSPTSALVLVSLQCRRAECVWLPWVVACGATAASSDMCNHVAVRLCSNIQAVNSPVALVHDLCSDRIRRLVRAACCGLRCAQHASHSCPRFLQCTIVSDSHDVNMAMFNAVPGGGFMYGTRDGTVHTFTPAPARESLAAQGGATLGDGRRQARSRGRESRRRAGPMQ